APLRSSGRPPSALLPRTPRCLCRPLRWGARRTALLLCKHQAPNNSAYQSSENPWARVASSAQAWAPNLLEPHGALRAGCARWQAIITRRRRGDIGSVRFRSIPLSLRLRAGSDAYPGRFSLFLLRKMETDFERSVPSGIIYLLRLPLRLRQQFELAIRR